MANILVVSDFPNIQYKKDSGTPALRLIIEALAKDHHLTILHPRTDTPDPDTDTITHRQMALIPGNNAVDRKMAAFQFKDAVASTVRHLPVKFSMVYGAGCCSVTAAARLGIPSVGRLFGTYLYPHLHNPAIRLVKFEEAQAFKAARKMDALIITNDGTGGDKVAEYYGVPKEKVHFWMNGVAVPTIVGNNHNQTCVFISMARHEGWKHVERIIDAFSQVDGNSKLLILGDGPETMNLIARVNRRGIYDRVQFVGELPRDEALELLSQADVMVSANDYSNISNPVLEAMAYGKPVIAWDSGMTKEVLNGSGIVVDGVCQMASCMALLATNPEARDHYGNAGREYAVKNFVSWDERIKREVAVCEGVMK